MEANEKTITIPDGWEFERIDERNEIDFLQAEVERYKEQNRQLIEMIFKIKDKQK